MLYNSIVIVIIPFILRVMFNVVLFVRVRSSSRRVETNVTTVTNSITLSRQQHARDIRLLKHMVFNFIVYLLHGAHFILLHCRILTWSLFTLQHQSNDPAYASRISDQSVQPRFDIPVCCVAALLHLKDPLFSQNSSARRRLSAFQLPLLS